MLKNNVTFPTNIVVELLRHKLIFKSQITTECVLAIFVCIDIPENYYQITSNKSAARFELLMMSPGGR